MDDHNLDPDLRNVDRTGERYDEETAAELTEPFTLGREDRIDDEAGHEEGGRGFGYTGLILSIIALFVMPVVLGAVGIVLGFIARGRGAEGLGAWAIGIGAAAVIMGLFIYPFF
ncbi:hypothetical protein QYG89_01535 [Bacillus sp. B190/17]|uniref:DUF4190 domain-containing protein n=1 Tax=Bacillus lumedeiriae TaxID=3058829 RepID=A0ABW8I5C3_9BACI